MKLMLTKYNNIYSVELKRILSKSEIRAVLKSNKEYEFIDENKKPLGLNVLTFLIMSYL